MKLSLNILILVVLLAACTNEQPTKNFETFSELPDPNLNKASWEKPIDKGLIASFVSIDNKYPKSTMPSLHEIMKEQRIEGWKGEKLSAQILLWSSVDVKQIEFGFSDFKSDDAVLPGSIAQARFVRYVMTDEFGDKNPCGKRSVEDYASSLAPDMLDTLGCFNIEAETVRPVWITIEIPQGAQSGLYKGTISLFTRDQKKQTFNLVVDVIDQTLPKASEWVIHMDLWQHPSSVARVHNLELWSDAHFDKMKPLMKMAADLGQKVITTNINKDPWNNQCFDAYEDMIIWTKLKDGKWAYDYTVFDRWVQFMTDLGVNKMINCYSMVPWNNEIHYIDETKKETINVRADPGTKIFEEMWGPFLTDFVKHLKEKGWLELTNIAMDERNPKDMEATLLILKKYAPELGISLADNHKSYKRYPFIKDMCIGARDQATPEDIKERRERGLITTYYVCCSHEFPNIFTFSEAAEATYISWYAAAADYDGFLRWAYNSWVENPLTDSRFRTFPAGDTYFVYPDARSSIRYERLLEGVQDFEKIHIIRKILESKNEMGKLEELSNMIAKFNTSKRTDHWNNDLNEAKKLLNKLSKDI